MHARHNPARSLARLESGESSRQIPGARAEHLSSRRHTELRCSPATMETRSTPQQPPHTTLTEDDRARIGRLLAALGPHVSLSPLGRYRELSDDDVWLAVVSQVCVMGSSRGMESIVKDDARRTAFRAAVALPALAAKRYRKSHLAGVLRKFSATRFPVRAARRLREVIDSPTAVQAQRCVILSDLQHDQPASDVRDALIRRCPVFKLKSASDLMLNVGLSHDVIALDVRVVGALRRYFKYERKAAQVQGQPAVYLSVEQSLREVCASHGASLGLLDRVLFQFGGMSVLEFAMTRDAKGLF